VLAGSGFAKWTAGACLIGSAGIFAAPLAFAASGEGEGWQPRHGAATWNGLRRRRGWFHMFLHRILTHRLPVGSHP
jgi:hypothetical protein